MISKRRDDKGRVLQQGEWQEPSGRYRYKYTDSLGKRKILGSITNFVGFPIPLVALSAHIE